MLHDGTTLSVDDAPLATTSSSGRRGLECSQTIKLYAASTATADATDATATMAFHDPNGVACHPEDRCDPSDILARTQWCDGRNGLSEGEGLVVAILHGRYPIAEPTAPRVGLARMNFLVRWPRSRPRRYVANGRRAGRVLRIRCANGSASQPFEFGGAARSGTLTPGSAKVPRGSSFVASVASSGACGHTRRRLGSRAPRLRTKMTATGDGEQVSDGRLAPAPLVSALISEESGAGVQDSSAPRPAAEMRSGRNKSFANSPGAPQAAPTPQASPRKHTPLPAMMSPFPASTFSVAHPLHCGLAAFRQQQPRPFPTMTVRTLAPTTPTTSPSQLASPTPSYSKARAHPVASPSKKSRKSRVVFDFTTEEMAKYFHMSQREAAQQLGVATVTIKRNCRRLGIVWPYRLMKSKKNAINWSAVSREDAQRIRQERALERAKAGRSPSSRSRSRSSSSDGSPDAASDDEAAAKAMAMLSHSSNSLKLTEAGRAFARLPLDCMDTST
ncbi:hypothetical protein PHYPSEUDO_011732 [Phytophthora pseudosyringae]|uniref:RWP-RK domain-containing protein n=1 Tax=Phytophthora pseudosyringae TaxID=221518 RepID=A0A8T1V8W7_9STRA|nr:hypothetical protein PHYPSEUDO_011732 [Phytophthora pseudosyringae]